MALQGTLRLAISLSSCMANVLCVLDSIYCILTSVIKRGPCPRVVPHTLLPIPCNDVSDMNDLPVVFHSH